MSFSKRFATFTIVLAAVTAMSPMLVWADGNEAHTTCEVDLKLLRPIELQCLTPLNLGRHVFAGGHGHIGVAPNGSYLVDGAMTLEAPYPALLEAWGEKFCPFTIEIRDTEVVNQMDGSTIYVELHLPNAENTMHAVFPESGHFPFYVGGQLSLTDDTMTGIYHGEFEAWVYYN